MNDLVPGVALLLCLAFPSALRAGEPRTAVERQELPAAWQVRERTDSVWMPAKVPGCIHLDLMTNGKIPDPFFGTNEEKLQWIGEKDWVYETTFDVAPSVLARAHVEMVFHGLDTYADVVLNGEPILRADNMFRTWRVDLTGKLLPKRNRITITFQNVFDRTLPLYRSAPYALQAGDNNDQAEIKLAPYSRKAQFHFGWDWGPRLITCGVWRPVELEAWDGFRIDGAAMHQDHVDAAQADISSVLEIMSTQRRRVTVSVTADDHDLGEEEVTLTQGLNIVTVRGHIQEPNLWWTNGLGSHHLYDWRATVTDSAGIVDVATARLGVRSLEVIRQPDSLGTSLTFRVNGVPVFMKGADYIPLDNFQPRVTSERYEEVIGAAAAANMNMLRVWGGGIYEDDRFYDACDRHGILLWHDLMFACAMYPADSGFVENVRREVVDNVRRIRNHASLAMYCGNNENQIGWHQWGWKQLYPPAQAAEIEQAMNLFYDKTLPAAVALADPTRSYQSSSPSAGFLDKSPMDGDIHYWGVWHGKEPFESYDTHIARFVSEFGFQSYPLLPSVERFTVSQDRSLHSPVMLAHQRCMADARRDREYGNRLIKSYMDQWMREPKDFASYLYASQVLQAEGVKLGIEAHRSAKPTCMGTLFWQINDCWPVASWSSIDYYGEWKALQYYARRLYAPVIVTSRIEEDGSIILRGVSDLPVPFSGVLEVTAMDFDGVRIRGEIGGITIPANGAVEIARLPKAEMLAGHDEERTVVAVSLRTDAGIVAETTVLFRPMKELALSQPRVSTEIKPIGRALRVTVRSSAFAKAVFLSVPGVPGRFSDNFFDLFPGVPRVVEFVPHQPMHAIPAITVMSLVDTYEVSNPMQH